MPYDDLMFIRKTRKIDRQTKKEYFLFQLVESYRTERGPRQRILLNLGSELPFSEEERKLLANRIEEIVTGNRSFVEYPKNLEETAQSYAKKLIRIKQTTPKNETKYINKPSDESNDYREVDVNSLRNGCCRTVGAEHIALETIKKLQLDKKLYDIGLTKKQVEIAIGVIIGRLIKPGSDRSTHNWLLHQSGLSDLLETDFHTVSLDAIYKIGDQLLKHKQKLESHLAFIENDLFHFEDTIVLYDLTNTYFEGSASTNAKAHRGRSKEKRSDCPLVTMGLVLNEQGFPKRSDIFPGNVSEPGTLKEVINQLNHTKTERPIIVLDAGFATETNLEWLRENQYPYIVSSRQKLSEAPHDLQYETVKEENSLKVEAAQLFNTETGETELYCRSEARKMKEQSMQSSFQQRLENDLQRASIALRKKGGTKDYKKVLERVGRLKEKHKRISSYYEIEVKPDKTGSQAVEIVWKIMTEKISNQFQGLYKLRTFGLKYTSKKLWNIYVMLTEIEEGFRCMKSELGLRPIFHQKEKRVDAHLFITILAYHVMQTIRYQLQAANIHHRWETIRENMSTQVRITTTMRLKNGRQLHIRDSSDPEPIHRSIYQALNLTQKPGNRTKTII